MASFVTPQEAQRLVDNEAWMRNVSETPQALARTVATEPERIAAAERAAAVKALRSLRFWRADDRADAIENGAPLTG